MRQDVEAEFDVVVIGGGPAGSSAAVTAARSGLRVCILDKSVFPREKLCGGLVTPRSKSIFQNVFDRKWKDDLFLASSNIRFTSEGRKLEDVDGYQTLYFTKRFDFDNYLISLAGEAGAVIFQGRGLDEIDFESNSIKTTTGNYFSFKVLIGCDGVNSIVARSLFGRSFDPDTIGFGLEVEVPRLKSSDMPNRVEIDFAGANWGYGWAFPKNETTTIGVGGIHQLNPNLKDSLGRYLRSKGLDISNFKVKGQYIPFGDFKKIPGKGNILLCGDAAGVVDPITGEGIAYAMQTGHAAALAASVAISSGDSRAALGYYMKEYEKVVGDIAQANFWRRFIFPKVIQGTFSWAFADAGTLQRGYLDILSGTKQYNDLPGLFWLQVTKAVKKLGRKLLSIRGLSR